MTRELSGIEKLFIEHPYETKGVYIGSMIDVKTRAVHIQLLRSNFQLCVESLVAYGAKLDGELFEGDVLRQTMMRQAWLQGRGGTRGGLVACVRKDTVGNRDYMYMITHKFVQEKLPYALADKPIYIGTMSDNPTGEFYEQVVCDTHEQCVERLITLSRLCETPPFKVAELRTRLLTYPVRSSKYGMVARVAKNQAGNSECTYCIFMKTLERAK